MEEGHDWAIFGLAGNLSIRDDSPRDGAERSRRGPVDSLLRQELPGDDPLAHRLLSPRLSSTYLAPHGPASRPTSLVSSGDDGDPIAPTTATIIAGAETHGSRSAKTYSPSPRKGLRYHHSVALSLHHHCFYVPSGLALDTPPWEATERKPPHCTSPRLSDYAIHPATPVHPNRLGFLPVGQATCSVKARHQQEPRHGGPSAALIET
ncbi:hypothetical protein CHGG_09393 [Chaetomium globosum CBS 148.51]|uniref:Uncharacterized protein n=1 Tax=Chaetomium globosum (strain ATCC 6205 / CBS 148.51 / DSM 1962 / NBRC 6347 / NRRL 1970) TaxID=306901 RepID=Q2GRL1_CHAGB|nr:uncharacterized protein CHGG_09393 [Chaetomium globosum CBS 148.51]EAQ85379.1 hypothetical protein CHGG_09393 [Chaetomium globosum CBS 148.51]